MSAFAAIVSCTECGKMPVDAVESNCCGDIYCWTCLLDVNKCENCGKNLNPDQCRSAIAVKKIIEKMSAQPPVIENAPKDNSANLSSSIPTLYDQLRSSSDKLFPCPEGCGQNVTSAQVEEHLQIVCQNVTVPCPNQDCDVKSRRSDADQHALECEHKVVECPYGCGQMKQSQLDIHKGLNTQQHLDMLLAKVEAQKEEIKELKSSPALVYDSMDKEAFPKRILLLLLCTVGMFLPLYLRLPIFVLLFVRMYQVLYNPYILERGKAKMIAKGYTIRGIRFFNAVAHLWFVWACLILFRAISAYW